MENIEREFGDSYRSLEKIHGVKKEWLKDAPTIESIREHIFELCGKKLKREDLEAIEKKSSGSEHSDQETDILQITPETYDETKHSIFVGHQVTADLKVMNIFDVPYFCT